MKIIACSVFCLLAIFGCKQKKAAPSSPSVTITPVPEPVRYFPVTSFLKGQISGIKGHINPLKYTIIGSKKDSVWLKEEDLDKEFSAFLSPEIDTLNMISIYKEEKFLDESINAFTYTYSPISKLPDGVQLQNWDVYVNPQEGNVKRIFMVKKITPFKEQQLTWQADEKWCRILTNLSNKDGLLLQTEEKITWNF